MRVQACLSAAVLIAVLGLCTAGVSYRTLGKCPASIRRVSVYKYAASQSQFEGEDKESLSITANVKVTCIAKLAMGRVGTPVGYLYDMVVYQTRTGGSVVEVQEYTEQELPETEGRSKMKTNIDDLVKGRFQFVQSFTGRIIAVFHSREEDSEISNLKKKIVSAFQANFKRTSRQYEADPQSAHVARYKYAPTIQGDEGRIKMHRSVKSNDVMDFSSHMPADDVDIDSEDDIEYNNGVLVASSGTNTVSFMPKDTADGSTEPDFEADSLEAEQRRKRGADSVQTFNDSRKMNEFNAQATYSLEQVSSVQLSDRERRSTPDLLGHPDTVESSTLAVIDHTRRDMQFMRKLRLELGDIEDLLATTNKDPKESTSVHKLEELLTLEAKYGPLREHSPVLDDVLSYYHKLRHSTEENDVQMRILIYFMISSEGSLRSQKVLLAALDETVDDEEHSSVVMYIALANSPQPELVSALEEKIDSDPHSVDPLLLAYGALISRASTDLQHRMTDFLVQRLHHAETNATALNHLILSLGNTASARVSTTITDYLHHPHSQIQQSAISALRFMLHEAPVQEALVEFLVQPDTSEEHVTTLTETLHDGLEHARNNYQEKPFNSDLAHALVSAAIGIRNEELHESIIKYLRGVNTPESNHLADVLASVDVSDSDEHSNTTRFRRGTNWDERNSVFDLVEPLSARQSDERTYRYRKSYIWGKKFGVSDGNLQFAAGGFMGVSAEGGYKLFGRAVAAGFVFGRRKTAVDFKVLNEKTTTKINTVLYVEVAGYTLVNVRETKSSTQCKTYSKPLYNKKYRLFRFKHSIYIYVGTLDFSLSAHVTFSGAMKLQFCSHTGSLTASAGLTPTVSLSVSATAGTTLALVVKGGITVTGKFNYVMNPELNTLICYKNFEVKMKNCAGIYHYWTGNTIKFDVWYQTRDWWLNWSKKKKWKAASKTWKVPGMSKRPIWEACDRSISC